MKRKLTIVLLTCVLLASCTVVVTAAEEPRTLYVYNWGDYMSLGTDGNINVNTEFEKRFNCKVVYSTYENNEVMYSKLVGGGVSYDVVIPSDYMIERMIAEDMLEKLNFDNIPNYKNIADRYKNMPFDPENAYSVPYTTGMVGLIYEKTLLAEMGKEAPTSWSALWDEDYAGKLCMIANPRDAFAIAQSLLGLDYNSTNPEDWEAAAKKLQEQKHLVQAYVDDEVYNKMEPGEAVLAPYFAGDYLMMLDANPNLGFVYPEEGVNQFVDSICVLKGSQNKDLAEQYINFLLDPEIALANAEYLQYASPNKAVYENEEYSLYGNKILYPDAEDMPKTQVFQHLPAEIINLMNTRWQEVKGGGSNTGMIIGLITVVVLIIAYLVFRVIRKKRREKEE